MKSCSEPRSPAWPALILVIIGWTGVGHAIAADFEEADALLRVGKYDECARMAGQEIARGSWGDDWPVIKIEAEVARGRYEAALSSLEDGLRRFPGSIALLWKAREVYRFNNRDADAAAALEAIHALVAAAPQRFGTPARRVAVGRFFLARGTDAKKVLDQYYDPALKQEPELLEPYLAIAELALEKQDEALAAETLAKVPKEASDNPRYQFLLARAFSSSDRAGSDKILEAARKVNPRHVDSLLLLADHRIDSERYDEAAGLIDEALAVNPDEPRGWAYRAVLAHLRNDRDGEAAARRRALAHWPKNPEVDHLIGRKLSQKYRFAEGSTYQRRALETDPSFLPAEVQLCQDLLRLGEEGEGWKRADRVFSRDGYNIVAFNLVTLRDKLAGFRTLRGDGFIVRMDPREADLYGPRVLDLLRRAKSTLCATYGVTPPDPVIVEIFPQKKEFGVRTFGLPGGDGLLGVCFGTVITANSPASQGEQPSNWESVLWHEYCHVVTLTKTRNTMPRWLSEGISVYEEQRHDPAWGAPFSPKFRAMVLGKELTPLSRLSSAFLAPESPLHLQFAYFETAMAVDFLVRRFGVECLTGLLDDLGAGTLLNESLPRRTKMTLVQLDEAFAAFAHQQASGVAPDLTWEEPDLPTEADSAAISTWLKAHPKSFHGLLRLGMQLLVEKKWPDARDVLVKLKSLYPEYVGPENPYMALAAVYRHLSDVAAERAVLDELVARDGNAAPACLRLIELDEAAGDWSRAAADARRLLAINPLIAAPHRGLAQAAEHLGQAAEAIMAYHALARVDDSDPAEIHFRLARLLREEGKTDEARREVLRSLEEAPRFLEAHRLLLELVEPGRPATSAPTTGSARP